MEYELTSDLGYKLLFHSREFDKSNWLSYYSVTLSCPHVTATIRVDNASFGISPVRLFSEINENWKGWNGEKSWGSLEGEFDLSATSDNIGKILLVCKVQTDYAEPRAEVVFEFFLELGQTESYLKNMKKFFNE
jgi:hypothetical protein